MADRPQGRGGRVISPWTRWAHRQSPAARRDGYRAHVAADPETGIITDERLTRASGAGELRRGGRRGVCGRGGRRRRHGRLRMVRDGDDAGGQLAWYGDSAYGTGELRAALAAAG